jgi:chemotaxis protein histidine kinase CheA/ActR/RegA family two-component response regulator
MRNMSNTFDKLSVLDSFIEEVNSYLPEIETNLERLAQSPGDMDALEETYRRSHTIGGSASMMDFPGLAHVAHGMEDILGDALDGLTDLDESTIGLLQRSLGRLHRLLEGIRGEVDEDAVIAEDDADYARYRAKVEPSLKSSPGVEDESQLQNLSALSAPQYFEHPLTPASSAMPSFEEVLASFHAPSVPSAEDIAWPEDPVPVDHSDDVSQQYQVQSSLRDVFLEDHQESSALEQLVASTRKTPAIPVTPQPPVVEPPAEPAVNEQPFQSQSYYFEPPQQVAPQEYPQLPSPQVYEQPPALPGSQSLLEMSFGNYQSAPQIYEQPPAPALPGSQSLDMGFGNYQSAPQIYEQPPTPALPGSQSLLEMSFGNYQSTPPAAYEQALPQEAGEAMPQAYEDLFQEARVLEEQAETFRNTVEQLRSSMTIIEAQRTEFRSFLDGSKDALDRMEDWAGLAMGLNLRNSPEQVRRYLPLSVMWVSNSKLKKVQEQLHIIANNTEISNDQVSATLQQLQNSISSFGEAFQQKQSQLFSQDAGWGPWQVQAARDAEGARERVTFERHGDLASLRAEMEAQIREEVREEVRREYESQSMRAELERQIREDVRREFEERQRLLEISGAARSMQDFSLQEVESRLRSEIEIQVRRDFLNQLNINGGDLAQAQQLAREPEKPAPGYDVKHTVSSSIPLQMSPTPPARPPVPAAPPPRAASPAPAMDFGDEAVEIFQLEAEEHLQTISMNVAALKGSPGNRELIQGIRRATHTLKGAAGMMGFRAIADLCHGSEDLLDSVMEGTTPITSEVMSLILDTAEALDVLITRKDVNGISDEERVQTLRARYVGLLGKESTSPSSFDEDIDIGDEQGADSLSTTDVVVDGAPQGTAASRGELTVRVRLTKLDELVNLFGELLVNRSVLEERVQRLMRLISDVAVSSNRLREVGQKLESRFEAVMLPSGRSVQVMPGEGTQSLALSTSPATNTNGSNGDGRPSHLSEFDELELDRYTEFHQLARGLSEGISDMTTLSAEMDAAIRECEGILSRENRLNTSFQDRLMKVRLVPLSNMTPRLYRAAYSVALKQHKEIDFSFDGDETEVDRTVFEEISGPLLHLIRNAVNHAIETPDARMYRGKAAAGQVKVSAAYEGNQIVITVRDDGTGIDSEHVRRTAITRGLIRPDQQLAESDLIDLIFRPGFSTAQVLSEESGRGVGLDVVRDSVSRLRGSLAVESMPGHGTAFTMTFPTSLAIQSVMMIRISGQQFAIPTASVEAIGRLDNFKRSVVSGQPAVVVQNEVYPLHMLSQYLSLPAQPMEDKAQVLLINAAGRHIALIVDEIKGKSDIVMKNLGPHLRQVHGVAGGTILGNGQVVLVLELNDLLSPKALNMRRDAVNAVSAPQAMPQSFVKQQIEINPARPNVATIRPTSSTPSIPERGKHVLVVDDSPSVRRVVSNMLKQRGWEVQTARDGVEALEMIGYETPAAVLLDIEMPRMDGYELISTIRAQSQYKTLPLVVLTSRAASKHQQRAMTLGADSYVVKPYQDDELISILNSLVYGAAVR